MLESVSRASNIHKAREVLGRATLKDGSIIVAFEQEGKERLTYSHQQHTKAETWCVKQNILNSLLIYLQ